jgi:DeoR family transcriptional regulator, aga operon transcriptional repressor
LAWWEEGPVSRYRRWNELLELLATRGQLQVEDAAKALGVSAATIRRDFDELAGQQMLTRIRGGAVAEGVNYDLPLRYKTERHPSEKQRIGALAASMVRAGQLAGLNGGTTTTEVARALATRSDLAAAGPSPTVTVVTNALNIATELAIRQHIKIVTTGGVARPQSYELTGPLATGVLEQVTLDVAFLGVDGIDAVAGATAHHEGEASINRLMGRQARQVIIVADSSKVGQRAFARICTQPRSTCWSPTPASRPRTRPGWRTPGSTLSRYDLVVIGDCNPDVLVLGGDVAPAFGQQEKLVDSISLVVGGSAAITAVAAARLGLQVALVAAVGADPAGAFMRDRLAAEGVDVTGVVVRDGAATGMTVALSRGGARGARTGRPGRRSSCRR